MSAHNRLVRQQRDDRDLARARAAATAGLTDRPTWTDALRPMASNALDAPGPLPVAAKERLRVCVDPLSGWGWLRDGALLPPGRVPTPVRVPTPSSPTPPGQLLPPSPVHTLQW